MVLKPNKTKEIIVSQLELLIKTIRKRKESIKAVIRTGFLPNLSLTEPANNAPATPAASNREREAPLINIDAPCTFMYVGKYMTRIVVIKLRNNNNKAIGKKKRNNFGIMFCILAAFPLTECASVWVEERLSCQNKNAEAPQPSTIKRKIPSSVNVETAQTAIKGPNE